MAEAMGSLDALPFTGQGGLGCHPGPTFGMPKVCLSSFPDAEVIHEPDESAFNGNPHPLKVRNLAG